MVNFVTYISPQFLKSGEKSNYSYKVFDNRLKVNTQFGIMMFFTLKL